MLQIDEIHEKRTRISTLQTVDIMATDDMVTQGAKSSVGTDELFRPRAHMGPSCLSETMVTMAHDDIQYHHGLVS